MVELLLQDDRALHLHVEKAQANLHTITSKISLTIFFIILHSSSVPCAGVDAWEEGEGVLLHEDDEVGDDVAG